MTPQVRTLPMTTDVRRALTSRKRRRVPVVLVIAAVAILLVAQAVLYFVAPTCQYSYQCDGEFFIRVFFGGFVAILLSMTALALLAQLLFGKSDTYLRRCGPVVSRNKSVWRLSRGAPNLTLWVGDEEVTDLSGILGGAFGSTSPLVGMDWACLDYTMDRVLLCVRDASGGVRYALPGYEPTPD
jgi:hypothetical protein